MSRKNRVRPGVVIRPLSGHRRDGRLGSMRSMSEGRIRCGVLPVGTPARDFQAPRQRRVVGGPAPEREGSITASSGPLAVRSDVAGVEPAGARANAHGPFNVVYDPIGVVSGPLTRAPASEGFLPGTAFGLDVSGRVL
jgi:hypothetical protein